MSTPPRRWPLRPILLGGVLLLAALVRLDYGSLERGNRLFHDGQLAEAEGIYRRSAGAEVAGAADYNLGTTLIPSGSPEAQLHLESAAASPDSGIAQRGSYNLGYLNLIRVEASLLPDSALTLLRASASASRRALRLDPEDENALWNAALAQRMIDSLTFEQRLLNREEDAGEDEIRLEDQALTRSSEGEGVSGEEPENPPPANPVGVRRGAATGAREAWASQDPGPMAPDEARALLASLSDDPEQLVRGLLWAHRPDVAWWNSEPYPGGNW